MFNMNRTVKKRILNKKECVNLKSKKILFFFKKKCFLSLTKWLNKI